jgi:HEAT repeats/PBS lyase HEAT-like repeat
LPCAQCWEARGDGRLVSLLVTRSEHGSRRAPQLLAAVGDRAAAPALREAVSHQDPAIRAAAISSLGWSGEIGDVAAITPATRDSERAVRMAARATLADLGGAQAADALASGLDGLEEEEERAHAVEALAWLGDARAIEPLHELVTEELGDMVPHYRRGVLRALARIGSRGDVLRMVGEVNRVVAAGAHAPGTPDFWRAQRVADQLWLALKEERPEFLDEAGARLREVGPELALARWPGSSGRPRIVDVEPLGDRVVRRATLAELSESPMTHASSPPPKFGGQPDWVEQPTWPLGADSAPMVFYAQLPVFTGTQQRTAYVFIDPEGDHWEPLGQGNAVIVQPGALGEPMTAPLTTGPQVFERIEEAGRFRRRWRAQPYERFIGLQDGGDPERWEWPELGSDTYRRDGPGDWNKLRGTPLFLKGEQSPPGEGWTFAFQFSAARAGWDLGDGAECYGFVREDGTGAFLWQCH